MNTEKFENFTLLTDGKNAFPEIIKEIENAKKSVYINMFIWRDDVIGNRMGQAVLDAAERGVQVRISVDRYGVVLEKAEESKKSFFHKKQTFAEKCKITCLKCMYPMKGTPKRVKDEITPLYTKILSHPNIIVEKDVFKADHSKYYIIDGEILFLGGINIEDKENGADMQGRVYQDYIVKMEGRAYVDGFLAHLAGKESGQTEYFFGINRKEIHRFEMEELYLSMIREAEKELCIVMAYFSPIKAFIQEIVRASERGVQVSIMIPQKANYQSDSNRKTVKKLMKATKNGIRVYLSPKMLHTKMMVNEHRISFGSTNITKKAFGQLDELNLFTKRGESAFETELFKSVEENFRLASRVETHKGIKYNKIKAFFEGFLV